ncbi:MAG TPA: glycosyltransferase family 39 protein [bacterium]|nr:glycosyltransferase family 39 protein [bacterium]HOM27029.1 glycosyltransferase family 39 protein [bacterium]
MNRKIKFFLFVIFFLGFFFRVLHLGKHSLWCDELLTISLGKHSIKWMIDYITYNDAHPPFFYLLVHFWLKFGENEIILRILPMLFGLLCIPYSYILGKKFYNEKIGLFLSLFVSLSPPFILWSQLIKSYSLLTFLTILSFIFFIEILNSENKKFLPIFCLSNILILYTHNFGFIVILIQILTLLILKKLNRKSFLLFFLIFLIYIPWLLKIPYQMNFTLGVRRPFPALLKLPYTLFYFFFGETLSPFNFKILIPAFITYSIIFTIGVKNLLKLQKEIKVLLSISLIFPLFFVFFPSTVPQNLIFISFFWYLLFSIGMHNFNYKNLLIYLNFLFLLPSLIFYYTDNISQYHDTSKLILFREIFKEIQKIEKDGDIILTTEKYDREILTPLMWYYSGKNKVFRINDKNDIDEVIKIFNREKKKSRFFLILDFINNPEISKEIREFFENKYEKLYEKKYIYNEKLLSRLKGVKEYYYLVEVYIFQPKIF